MTSELLLDLEREDYSKRENITYVLANIGTIMVQDKR